MKTKSDLFFPAATVLLLLSICAVPSPVAAQCTQWDVGHDGQWQLRQSNNVTVTMKLQQNGKSFTGTASFTGRALEVKSKLRKDLYTPTGENGQVDGTIDGNKFNAKIFWENGDVGVYKGKVNPQGRIEGTGYEKKSPATKQTWYSIERMNCASQAAATPAPAPAATTPPPVNKVSKKPSGAGPLVRQMGLLPEISASSTSVNIPRRRRHGTVTITWSGGQNHPNAELWVQREGGDEELVVKGAKGSQEMNVQLGRNVFILSDAGQRLATVEVEGLQ